MGRAHPLERSHRLRRVTRGYVKRNIVKGDLVFTSGSMGQTKWEKDGETFYGVTLAAERLERLCKGPNHGDDKNDEPQERRSGPPKTPTSHSDLSPRTGEASASPPFSLPYRRGPQSVAYQIYRIGEWERVGGVDGYSTIRAYLQPGLYETEAYARKKAARLADQDYENGGDGGFQVVAVGESPFDERRPSLSAWWAAHPHILDFDDSPF